jgi:DNA mismatch endonuclease, patch repair protein
VKRYESNIKVPRFREEDGFYTTAERSSIMKKIKAKDTKAEVRLRLTLWHLGYRYRKNVKKLPGCPDVVFTRAKIVIFIDGEFWHGFNWIEKKASIKSNRDFWIPKIERNMQRDKQNKQVLENLGYIVIRFWEKEVKEDLNGCIQVIQKHLKRDR